MRNEKLAMLIVMVLAVFAARAEEPIDFDIPAQRLETALLQFSEQSGVQVSVSGALIAGMASGGVSGRFTTQSALAKLLEGCTLRILPVGDLSFALVPASAVDEHTSSTRSAASPAESADAAEPPESSNPGKLGSSASGHGSNGGRTGAPMVTETVIVTGTHIRGVEPVGTVLTVLDRAAIEATGLGSVHDVVRSLPQTWGGGQSESTRVVGGAPINLAYGSGINLRGLGADATLTLVNGRRLAPAGLGAFVDVSAIPLSAVDRIEIVADGASATYGSDAIAGVVNIRLREGENGANTRARFATLREGDAPEIQLAQAIGTGWEGGNLLLAYEFYRRRALPAAARSYTASSDLRGFGGSDFSSIQANPGNITRIGATPATLAIPSGQDGTELSESALLPGQVNLENLREGQDLLPRQERHGVLLSASHALGERWSIFSDALFSERKFRVWDDRPGVNLVVPESNAYRQMNGLFPGSGNLTVAYSFTDDLGPLLNVGRSRLFSGTLGAGVKIASAWRAEVSGTYSQLQDDSDILNRLDTAALPAALASSNPATAFNPFADGSNTDPAVIASLTGSQINRVLTSVRSLAATADGPALRLRTGDVRIAIGAETRAERFRLRAENLSSGGVVTDVSGGIRPGERSVWAAFAEARMPLVAENRAWPGVRQLELSASGRYEHYDDVGDTFDPKFGLRWSPASGVNVRGTYGTSFRAPLLRDLGTPITAQVITLPASVDPFATGGSTVALALTGGNRGLEPATADTWTAGFEFTPAQLAPLRIEVTYFDLTLKGRVASPGNLIPVLANPQFFPGVVTREPSQAQIAAALASADQFAGVMPVPESIEAIIDARLANQSAVQVDGLDLSTRYAVDLAGGILGFDLRGSLLLSFAERFTRASPPAENVSTVNKPVDLRLRGGISWSRGGLGTSLYANYTDHYRDTSSTPARKVASWTTLDMQVRYSGAGHHRYWLESAAVALSVSNLLDEDPPFVNNFPGYGFDPANASPYGRMLALDISYAW